MMLVCVCVSVRMCVDVFEHNRDQTLLTSFNEIMHIGSRVQNLGQNH